MSPGAPPLHIHVIGLAGPADAGKDTVARMLHTHAGFYPLAFADALRGEICAGYGIDISMLTDRATKETPLPALALSRCQDDGFIGAIMRLHHERDGALFSAAEMDRPRSPRQIMRWWGTEYRRAKHPRYWVSIVAERIRQAHTRNIAHAFVVSDVRFQDEAALVRQYGGLIWQIKRPGREAEAGAHVSATTGAEFQPHTVIDNKHDLRYLQARVLEAWWGHGAGFAPGQVRVELAP